MKLFVTSPSIGWLLYFIIALLPLSRIGFADEIKEAQVKSVNVEKSNSATEIRITGDKIGASTVYALPNPARIVVDLAEASLAQNFQSNIKADGIMLQSKQLNESKPAILRLEFSLPDKIDYETKKNENEIVLTLKQAENTQQVPPLLQSTSKAGQPQPEGNKNAMGQSAKPTSPTDKIGSMIGASKNIDNQLPDINPLDPKLSSKAKAQKMEDAFNFSGYQKERITVEFQKMDLHNVFNFLRQVSGVNIVVDESVQGSLTLVLDDVPWDFALDIILNLKDLEKEERFNTLVIYPKKKEFKWPDKGQNNLSFQADTKVVEREALTIKQQAGHSFVNPEVKQDLLQGENAEKSENFETAVSFYEKAYEKWPANSKIANKVASIYLSQLRQYSKSLYYANLALKNDKNNSESLLLAAIASANLQDHVKAESYFDRCTKTKTPLKEALLSYASFCEDRQNYNCTLANIGKYNAIYGEDLASMVSAARVYDKMGQGQKAVEIYKKMLLSGMQIPPDLDRYVRSRVTMN